MPLFVRCCSGQGKEAQIGVMNKGGGQGGFIPSLTVICFRKAARLQRRLWVLYRGVYKLSQ